MILCKNCYTLNMDRRVFFSELGAAGVIAVIGTDAYLRNRAQYTDVTVPQNVTAQNEWSRMSAVQRIQALEYKKYSFEPEVANREMVKAVAEVAIPRLGSTKNPQELTGNVHFSSPKEVADAIGLHTKTTLSPEQRQAYEQTTIETAVQLDNAPHIYFNEVLFNGLITDFRGILNRDAAGRARIGDVSVPLFLRKNVLFHAFAHTQMTEQPYPLTPIQIGFREIPYLDKLHGFTFFGTAKDGTYAQFGGAMEGMTEAAKSIIAKGCGETVLFPSYADTTHFIEKLNQRALISDADFIKYYTGQKPTAEMFERWGKETNGRMSKVDTGVQALFILSMLNDPRVNFNASQARQELLKFGFQF